MGAEHGEAQPGQQLPAGGRDGGHGRLRGRARGHAATLLPRRHWSLQHRWVHGSRYHASSAVPLISTTQVSAWVTLPRFFRGATDLYNTGECMGHATTLLPRRHWSLQHRWVHGSRYHASSAAPLISTTQVSAWVTLPRFFRGATDLYNTGECMGHATTLLPRCHWSLEHRWVHGSRYHASSAVPLISTTQVGTLVTWLVYWSRWHTSSAAPLMSITQVQRHVTTSVTLLPQVSSSSMTGLLLWILQTLATLLNSWGFLPSIIYCYICIEVFNVTFGYSKFKLINNDRSQSMGL